MNSFRFVCLISFIGCFSYISYAAHIPIKPDPFAENASFVAIEGHRIEALRKELDKEKLCNELLKAQVKKLEKHNSSLERKIDEKNTENNDLVISFDWLKVHMEQADQELLQQRRICLSLEMRLKQEKFCLSKLEKTCEDAEKERDFWRGHCEDMTRKHDALSKDYNDAQAIIIGLAQECRGLKNDKDNLEAKLEEERRKTTASIVESLVDQSKANQEYKKKLNSEWSQKVDNLEGELQSCKGKLKRVNIKLRETQTYYDSLKEKYEKLMTENQKPKDIEEGEIIDEDT